MVGLFAPSPPPFSPCVPATPISPLRPIAGSFVLAAPKVGPCQGPGATGSPFHCLPRNWVFAEGGRRPGNPLRGTARAAFASLPVHLLPFFLAVRRWPMRKASHFTSLLPSFPSIPLPCSQTAMPLSWCLPPPVLSLPHTVPLCQFFSAANFFILSLSRHPQFTPSHFPIFPISAAPTRSWVPPPQRNDPGWEKGRP